MSSGMAGTAGIILLLCLVNFTNVHTANIGPSINQVVYQVCEDTPPGAYAFTIQASDPEGDPLTYTLVGANAAFFSVEKHTGRVSVRTALDRESNDVMPLNISVSDGLNPTPGQLNIILEETNDNKPIFQEPSYDVDVPENTPVGTPLFTVRATDADISSGGIITYSIDESTPSDGIHLFSIVPNTGEVKLSGNLNYTSKSTFYRLKINATDGGGRCYFEETKFYWSVVFSFITVVDVADLDPRFIGIPYTASVEENSSVGTSVLKVTAIDQDTGVNDNMIYSIEDSSAAGKFTISPSDGIISVASAIDREAIGDSVILSVKATESKENIHGIHASTTADVLINIMDINDNKPEFYKCEGSTEEPSCNKETHFTGEVLEHTLGSIPIQMTVIDPDKMSRIRLTLEGEDKDVFSVQPQTAMSQSVVQLLVRQPENLDFEKKQQMILQVIATDEDNTSFLSTATVTINIKDANDNSPKFSQDTYKLNVSEHSPAGTVVATITAEDPDTMDQGKIIYRLLPESILLYFDVMPNTGTIYVKNATLLDREVRSLYSATLEAKDTEGKPGTAVLEITVTDINDQPPVMNRDSYLEFVEEGGQLNLKIEATDADEPNTVNSQIVYGIMPSKYSANFTINPNTGVLRNEGELDREALDPNLNGRIELNITATDKGTPPLSTIVPVIIVVEDVNDNSPIFGAASYKFSVKEGEKGAFVGSVFAEDKDQTTDFNRISFSIIDGSFGSFIVRTFAQGSGYMGNISVDPDIELDYESARKQFKLRVEATDLEQKKAVVMVDVDVLDVNDERPEFRPVGPVTVKENTTISEAIGKFLGYDKDGNHSLIYELESVKCRCNDTLTPCDWFLLDPNGEVKVNPKVKIDYEECKQAVIEAQVVDEYTEKGENNSATTGEMVINIEDINDNAPEFISSNSVFVVVSESASKGTSVAGVTATDRDSGTNRQIEFKVTAVQFEDTNNQTTNMRTLFEAVTTQQKDIFVGIIQTTEGLDMSLKGKYLVTVTATDTGGLSSSTVLDIFTVDESYKVELQFSSTTTEVEEKLSDIVRALTAATKAAIEIVAIKSDTSESTRASDTTIVVAYFVYANGTALTSSEVERMLSDPEHYPILRQLGLKDIGTAPLEEQEVDYVQFILLGIVAGLVIVLTVLTTSLLCTRRNYRRKLKAAKAMNSATMVTSDNQKSGAVVPGTNKYTMEGANPVFGNIDTIDLDEETSDVDKLSVNSMDYPEDMAMPEKVINPLMIIEEDEEYSGPPEYIEPLGEALAQREQMNSSNKGRQGITNPAFDTTNL